MKPSFIIIGGVKCASSSLYRYLNYHPQVLPCKTKEPGFFNNRSIIKTVLRFNKYLDLFPKLNHNEVIGDWLDLGKDNKMHASQFVKTIENGRKYITGEATANTWTNANPLVIKMMLPKVKLILLMRDPSERFISHYNMFMRFHQEGRKGYDLGNLDQFIDQEIDAHRSGKNTRILSQGMYIKYLPKWKKTFGDNLKMYETPVFNNGKTNDVMNEICDFLEIARHDFASILKVQYNSTGKRIERSSEYNKLNKFYAPQVKELKEKYNINLI